ncbi:hypothetical protein [Streptomyces africanus]|uniref:hypothetical protein n=1 Tax=Streptomyces africanus TaxID=231024 RepID=UPI000A3CC598|nr:hypothetical protein [Streptomyces africanus]
MASTPPEILLTWTTWDGYSFLFLAKGKGQRRRYWWACGACWEQSTPVAVLDEEDRDCLEEEARAHWWWCLGSPAVPNAGVCLQIR